MDLRLVFLQSMRRRLEVCTLVAGGNGSGFLMRGADELPEHRAPDLLERLKQAIDEASLSRGTASGIIVGGHHHSSQRRLSASGDIGSEMVDKGPAQVIIWMHAFQQPAAELFLTHQCPTPL